MISVSDEIKKETFKNLRTERKWKHYIPTSMRAESEEIQTTNKGIFKILYATKLENMIKIDAYDLPKSN